MIPQQKLILTPETDAWQAAKKKVQRIATVAIGISLLVHALSYIRLEPYSPGSRTRPMPTSNQVKIKLVTPEKKKPTEPDIPRLLETPQTKTERPENARFAGAQDHIAEKETKVKKMPVQDKALDPGQKGNPDAGGQKTKSTAAQPVKPVAPQTKTGVVKSNQGGSLAFDTMKPQPRNAYEALLPSSVSDLPGQLNAGYQDYIDDKIAEGDRIDINTSEYRFIGYFTNMRKAIELVWNYPQEASRKGLQGEVGLEFAIGKDGSASGIRVIKSSGYEVLDRAIVDAIKLASPFSPLPDGFGKKRIIVTGSFRYILTAFGTH